MNFLIFFRVVFDPTKITALPYLTAIRNQRRPRLSFLCHIIILLVVSLAYDPLRRQRTIGVSQLSYSDRMHHWQDVPEVRQCNC